MIQILDPVVASRIAAGEVIENPSSAIRELIDNSIDAKASKITIKICEGGISSLSVVDNGCGMDSQDLRLACISHATSKIKTLDDLFSLKTMGFRGEALPSIAACSRLTISSNGYRVEIDNGKATEPFKDSSQKGCSVTADGLFDNLPARKLFLKRPSAEATACRKVLVEKAMCSPEIEYLYYEDNELKLHLPKASRKDRVLKVMALDKDFVPTQAVEMENKGGNATLYALASDPSCHRRDRTRVRLFINNRPVDSFPLVQAITNAYSVALPGGAFPYFSLFIENEPSLVDFNVHPAKRECRLRNQSEIYSMVTHMIRKALLEKSFKTEEKPAVQMEIFSKPTEPAVVRSGEHHIGKEARIFLEPKGVSSVAESKPFEPDWFEKAKKIMDRKPTQAPVTQAPKEEHNWTYVGQVFNTFLLVEKNEELLFIDQHAAHERLLYDEITSLKNIQNLIVPYRFETDRSVDTFLLDNSFIYQDLGVQLIRIEPMVWEMTTVPATARENEEKIAAFIRNATGDIDEAKKGLFAVIACHSAIKAGDQLDRISAEKLVEKVFTLDAMLCPHGRSFVYKVSKETLYKLVGRIV